ncbi:hypothetical protein CHUAL_004950 [Chamberlinius hualienensis]
MDTSQQQLAELERHAESLERRVNHLKEREAAMTKAQKAAEQFKFEFMKHFQMSNLKEISTEELKNMISRSVYLSGIEFEEAEVLETLLKFQGRAVNSNQRFLIEIQTDLNDDNVPIIKRLNVEVETDSEKLQSRLRSACKTKSFSRALQELM